MKAHTVRDVDWQRALSTAIREDSPQAVLDLLGDELDVPYREGPLRVLAAAIPAFSWETSCEVAKALLAAGADPIDAGKKPSILVRALAAGVPSLVKAVEAAGGTKGVKLTPAQRLMLAVCRDDVAEVKRLLASPKIKPTSYRGNGNGPGYGFVTTLTAAARGGFSDVAAELLRAGCPPTWGGGKWDTTRTAPAAQAAFFGHGALAHQIGGVPDEALAWQAHLGGYLELARSFDPTVDERRRAALASVRPSPPEDMLGRWRAELAEHRQPWPEWVELEACAAEEWSVEPGSFTLQHPKRELSIERRGERPAAGLPAWLSPLAGLRPRRDSKRHPLFGQIGFGPVAKASASYFPELAYVPRVPSGCVALMLTIHGGLVVARAGEVLTVRGTELARIGSLDVFARYAIFCALRGKDWMEGLHSGLEREAYPLELVIGFD